MTSPLIEAAARAFWQAWKDFGEPDWPDASESDRAEMIAAMPAVLGVFVREATTQIEALPTFGPLDASPAHDGPYISRIEALAALCWERR